MSNHIYSSYIHVSIPYMSFNLYHIHICRAYFEFLREKEERFVQRIIIFICVITYIHHTFMCLYHTCRSIYIIFNHVVYTLNSRGRKRSVSCNASSYSCVYTPPAPMNHVKIFKGQPRQFALSELVQALYKSFSPDHFGQVEINHSTMLRNKTSTA